MQYRIEISELAEKQYDNILNYLLNRKKNPQAVSNVMEDFDYTVGQLKSKADVFGYCRDERLRAMGF